MNQQRQNTMCAVALDQFGGIKTLKMRTLPIPEVESDEVLIQVESAGVAEWDPFEREGGFAKMFGTTPKFPYMLGSDRTGTVAALGTQVQGLQEGDRVYAAALANHLNSAQDEPNKEKGDHHVGRYKRGREHRGQQLMKRPKNSTKIRSASSQSVVKGMNRLS
jgi:NADPH:quinone reductase-like Zn-dependent oxidoreductase